MNNITLKQLNDLFGNDHVRVWKDDDGISISVWDPTTKRRIWLDVEPNHQPAGNDADGVLIKIEMFGVGDLLIKKFAWEPDNEPDNEHEVTE